MKTELTLLLQNLTELISMPRHRGVKRAGRQGALIRCSGLRLAGSLAWSCAALVASAGDMPTGVTPGQRVLLDAHNCYPYEGLWTDRLDRALSVGTPLAIEIDLIWDPTTTPGAPRVVVRHGGKATGDEPTFQAYFFEKARPIVERALRQNDHSQWPLLTLNINDLRADEPEFFTALWNLMGTYEPWLCTAFKSADVSRIAPLDLKPILVLTSDGKQQFKTFYDAVPPGGKLRMFAAGKPDRAADNFRRWLNYAWKEVEPEGQNNAGDWTAQDAARLKSLVDSAHQRGYWVRFYTLNGHDALDVALRGWTPGYNFGSLQAAKLRWRAAQAAGVDFIASDQYEECAKVLRRQQAPFLRSPSGSGTEPTKESH